MSFRCPTPPLELSDSSCKTAFVFPSNMTFAKVARDCEHPFWPFPLEVDVARLYPLPVGH